MNINSIVNLKIILQQQRDETRSCPGTGMHMTPGITLSRRRIWILVNTGNMPTMTWDSYNMPQSSYCWCDALNERSLIWLERGKRCIRGAWQSMSQRPSEWNKIRWIQIYILESTVYRGGKNVEIPNGCDIKHLWRIESECTIVSEIIKIY